MLRALNKKVFYLSTSVISVYRVCFDSCSPSVLFHLSVLSPCIYLLEMQGKLPISHGEVSRVHKYFFATLVARTCTCDIHCIVSSDFCTFPTLLMFPEVWMSSWLGFFHCFLFFFFLSLKDFHNVKNTNDVGHFFSPIPHFKLEHP